METVASFIPTLVVWGVGIYICTSYLIVGIIVLIGAWISAGWLDQGIGASMSLREKAINLIIWLLSPAVLALLLITIIESFLPSKPRVLKLPYRQ